MTVNANGYLPLTKLVTVSAPQFLKVMFRLTKDESVMGLPRLVFVMFAGLFYSCFFCVCFKSLVYDFNDSLPWVILSYCIVCVLTGLLCLLLVVCGACSYALCQRRSKRQREDNYSFSILSQRAENFDEVKEMFSTPVLNGMKVSS